MKYQVKGELEIQKAKYSLVVLMIVVIQERMHILVAKAFLPNIYGKPHVNHKDGKRSNNRLYNLEWCTRSENMKHVYDTGLNSRSKKKNKNTIQNLS